MARIAVATSGGVDSSVAAAAVVREGHDAFAVTFRAEPGSESAVAHAAEVARFLGIEHHVVDLRREFQHEVIDYFADEYAMGRTPNPCVRCNQTIKFGALLSYAKELGAEALATGHYARVSGSPRLGWQLRRALDASKDQSYVLAGLRQDQLAAAMFPLGELTKQAVRETACRLGLPTASRPDSQDLCFADGAAAELVVRLRPSAGRPGEIVDTKGRVLGRHRGLARYTVGQRRGLGLAQAQGWYVCELRPAVNRLVVGGAQEAAVADFSLAVSGEPSPRQQLPTQLYATVQVRYRMTAVPCLVTGVGTPTVNVRLAAAVRGVAPGQTAVVYSNEGSVLLGGSIMAPTSRCVEESQA